MRKILLVCLDNLGDLMFTTALAEAIRHEPGAELSLWCKDYTARIGHVLPGVHQVFAADPFWDKSPGRPKGSWRIFLRTLRTIRKKNFDLAIIPSTCWRTALFIRLAGIPHRVGLKGRKNQRFLTDAVPAPSREEPVVAGLMRAFKKYLPADATIQTRLDPKRLPQLQLPAVLESRPYVCIHAFAGRRDRCAPLEILQNLAGQLEQRGFSVLWLGTPQELNELRSGFGQVTHYYFADQWAHDLLSIAWLISQAKYFIGHDSGPLHVAGALGLSVLGFYLPGEPKRTMPQGRAPSVLVVRDQPGQLNQAAADVALEKLLQL